MTGGGGYLTMWPIPWCMWPHPQIRGQTETHLWKLYLPQLRLGTVNQWRIYVLKFCTPPFPPGSKFFKFHVVFGKFWQNCILAPPPPEDWHSPPRGNPGSATVNITCTSGFATPLPVTAAGDGSLPRVADITGVGYPWIECVGSLVPGSFSVPDLTRVTAGRVYKKNQTTWHSNGYQGGLLWHQNLTLLNNVTLLKDSCTFKISKLTWSVALKNYKYNLKISFLCNVTGRERLIRTRLIRSST